MMNQDTFCKNTRCSPTYTDFFSTYLLTSPCD